MREMENFAINENLKLLRNKHKLSQEKIAEKIGVSRQTVTKWESGNSLPDLLSCVRLAELFDISIEDLLCLDVENLALSQEKGKYIFGSVTVQENGQISLPPRARKVFSIKTGDELLLIGDVDRGLGLVNPEFFLSVYQSMFKTDSDDGKKGTSSFSK